MPPKMNIIGEKFGSLFVVSSGGSIGGVTHYKTIINVGTMKMLSSRGDSQGHQSYGNDQPFPEPAMGDDVPF